MNNQTNNNRSIDWAAKEKEELENHERVLIPWIRTRPDLFDITEREDGIIRIIFKEQRFPQFEYLPEEVTYKRFNDAKYYDKTQSRWLFYTMINVSSLDEIVSHHMSQELQNKEPGNGIMKVYYRIKGLVFGDPRKEYESAYLYFNAVIDCMGQLGYPLELCDQLHEIAMREWDEKGDKDWRQTAITPVCKLTYRLWKLYEENNDVTKSVMERKRKEIEERNKERAKEREAKRPRIEPELCFKNK